MGFDRTETLASPTGARLNLLSRRPDHRPRAVVQVNHGLAEHAVRYARFADVLAGRGVATFAHDHRGHGHTRAPDAPRGRFAERNGAEMVVADVTAVHERIAAEFPGIPVVAFGHSMGGLVTMGFVTRHSQRIAGAAIWNANFSAGLLGHLARALLAWERFRIGSDVPSRLMPRLTFGAWAKQVGDGRTAFDWLSRDTTEVDRYVADPLCGWDPSVSMWRDAYDFVVAGADDRGLAAIRRDLPVNLVGGARDPATDFGKAVEALAKRMRAAGFSNLQSAIYPQTRHESLNELNRDVITADFLDWLDRVVPQREMPAGDGGMQPPR